MHLINQAITFQGLRRVTPRKTRYAEPIGDDKHRSYLITSGSKFTIIDEATYGLFSGLHISAKYMLNALLCYVDCVEHLLLCLWYKF